MAKPSSRVTIVDIAHALGVTATTVSNAFNRPDQLSPALRLRVLDTARDMGYHGPDAAARSMRRGRLGAIGVLYADELSNAFTDAAFVLFLQGLTQAVEVEHLAITLIPSTLKAVRDPKTIAAAVVDGFVVYSMAEDDPLLSAVLERHLPVVIADSPPIPGLPFVGIDDHAAAELAARHLLALGHRQIGVLAAELNPQRRRGLVDSVRFDAATHTVNRDRLQGYFSAIAAAGIALDRIAVEEIGDGPLEHEAEAAAVRLLQRHPRPTAVLAMSDRLALAACTAATAMGIAIPVDLSIVGFDDIAAAAQASPALTTVSQPHIEKGQLAGQALVSLLAGRAPTDEIRLPTTLHLRESCAPPRE